MPGKKVIQFICYSPRIYSGFDKYNLELARNLNKKGYGSVFVYLDRNDVYQMTYDLKAESVILEYISTKNKASILFDVLRIFRRYKPAVVHAHFENYIQLLVSLFSLIYGARFFITFHSSISPLLYSEYRESKGILKMLFLRLYYKYLILVSKNVICVSRAIKEQFSLFANSGSKKIKCLRLGVEVVKPVIGKGELRKKYSLPEDLILICNVSAIEPLKGIDVLIDSLLFIKSAYNVSSVRGYHIGGFRAETEENRNYRDALFRKITELQLENDFIWLGPRNDITEILPAFDIYVQPSLREGIPVAVMEACSRGLPVIGSNAGGIPDIVFHGINGLLFTPGSSSELAERLNEMIGDMHLTSKMAEESFKIAELYFNRDTQVRLLEELYFSGLV